MSDPVEGIGAPRVLVAEDDASLRAILRFNLEEEGFVVTAVARGDEAIAALTPEGGQEDRPPFDLVVTDVKMPSADGLEVLRAARTHHPDVGVVIVTAFGTVDEAIHAMGQGAADYITKPFRQTELRTRVRRALEQASLRRETRALRERAVGPDIVTHDPRMLELLAVVDRVASADVPVLITGESGTGKELVARRLHAASQRSGPFVPVNCAALPGPLLESELFGHERGAFTGAQRAHAGKFERADGGTLFLDEVGELPQELQAKLLRVLEEGVIDRVGSTTRRPVDVRLVAATNRDLVSEIADRAFREDLYHRLSVIPVHIPPLRERRADLPLLVRHFLRTAGAPNVRLAPAVMDVFARAPWPGNLRELRNSISRMVLLRRGDVLDLADLALPGLSAGPAAAPVDASPPGLDLGSARVLVPGAVELPEVPFSLPELEQEIILKAIERHGGNRSAAARYLGIPRHVLLYRLSKYESSP